jgi:autotransporter-associated beta strand protein
MKVGGGTLTLTGDNTYSDNTEIDGGTLQLGDGTTSGSVAGDIDLGLSQANPEGFAWVVL